MNGLPGTVTQWGVAGPYAEGGAATPCNSKEDAEAHIAEMVKSQPWFRNDYRLVSREVIKGDWS